MWFAVIAVSTCEKLHSTTAKKYNQKTRISNQMGKAAIR